MIFKGQTVPSMHPVHANGCWSTLSFSGNEQYLAANLGNFQIAPESQLTGYWVLQYYVL